MAQYVTAAAGWTPVNHADAASSLANSSYQALAAAAASTDRVVEVFIGGEATSSTVNRMALRRCSAQTNTPTNVVPAALNPLSQASAAQGHVLATTGPTIASTGHLLNLAMNAFGGIIRWVAAPGEEIWITTATQPNSTVVLDSISGIGTVSSHIVFEEM